MAVAVEHGDVAQRRVLHAVDPTYVAARTIPAPLGGATTCELNEPSIGTAALLTAGSPEYDRPAVRLPGAVIGKDVAGDAGHAARAGGMDASVTTQLL